MNKKQLEEIRRLASEIADCIKQDSSGSFMLSETFEPFVEAVTKELQNQIWDEYEAERKKKGIEK